MSAYSWWQKPISSQATSFPLTRQKHLIFYRLSFNILFITLFTSCCHAPINVANFYRLNKERKKKSLCDLLIITTHQYSVRVHDGVQSVSYCENCAVCKCITNDLLNSSISATNCKIAIIPASTQAYNHQTQTLVHLTVTHSF